MLTLCLRKYHTTLQLQLAFWRQTWWEKNKCHPCSTSLWRSPAVVDDQLSPLYQSVVCGCGLLLCLCDAGCWKSLTVSAGYQEIDSRACFSSRKEKTHLPRRQRGRVEATTRWRERFFHFSHGWILKDICRRVALHSNRAALEQRRQKTHFVVPLVFIPSFDTGIGRTNIQWILFTQPLVAQHHEHLFWFSSSFHIISGFIGLSFAPRDQSILPSQNKNPAV